MPPRLARHLLEGVSPLPKLSSSLSADAKRLLYYSTSTKDALPSHPPVRTENFGQVHYVGQRDTDVCQYRVSRAPLCQRNQCSYTKDYVPLPLDHVAVNKELATIFAPVRHAASTPAIGGGTTSYEAEYVSYQDRAPQTQLPLLNNPWAATNTIPKASDHMLVTRSVFKHEYPVWDRATREPCPKVKSGLGEIADFTRVLARKETSYQETFPVDERKYRGQPEAFAKERKMQTYESGRVMAASVPMKVQQHMTHHNIRKVCDLPPMRDMLRQPAMQAARREEPAPDWDKIYGEPGSHPPVRRRQGR